MARDIYALLRSLDKALKQVHDYSAEVVAQRLISGQMSKQDFVALLRTLDVGIRKGEINLKDKERYKALDQVKYLIKEVSAGRLL